MWSAGLLMVWICKHDEGQHFATRGMKISRKELLPWSMCHHFYKNNLQTSRDSIQSSMQFFSETLPFLTIDRVGHVTFMLQFFMQFWRPAFNSIVKKFIICRCYLLKKIFSFFVHMFVLLVYHIFLSSLEIQIYSAKIDYYYGNQTL